MKRIVTVFMVIALLFAFTACSNHIQNQDAEVLTENPSASNPTVQSTENDKVSENGKALIVYFSASGNTENVAEYIAEEVNGDLFEIVPKNVYTGDDLNWRDENSRVNYEHDNESARNIELVQSTVDNFSDYDIVFIGFPIWWGIAAWPVDTFVKANDFTGKTVVPFCTSTSSGLGQSGELLKEMAGTGNWLDGKRFQSNVSESEVVEWVKGLNLSR